MKYFSTFSGIGGFELGIHNAWRITETRSKDAKSKSLSNISDGFGGWSYPTCVGYSEIDKYATQVYSKHFKEVKNYGDITKIKAEELPDFDCLVGGFPCQAFSIAGKRGGFEDTRGTLFFDLARILRTKQPRLFVFENVKGLLSHDNGKTFRTIITAIDELGYDAQWQIVNSKNHGVPQNRERVIIVGHLRGSARPQVFPLTGNSEADFVLPTLTARYYGAQANGGYIRNKPQKVRVGTLRTHKDGNGFREIQSGVAPTIPARAREDGSGQPVILTGSPRYENGKRKVTYKESDTAPTIRATQFKSGDNQPIVAAQRGRYTENGRTEQRLEPRKDGLSNTLTAVQKDNMLLNPELRRLTPIECERLQAFPDDWTRYATDGSEISDSQRYKMCGNAVTTNVIQAVFEQIFTTQETIDNIKNV